MIGVEYLLLIWSVLILLSIAIAKVSDNLGVPTLLLFIGVGMLAGSEGPGGIHFDDPLLAQSIGIIALVFILFAGGLDTSWPSVRPVIWHGIALSTVGVLVTALSVGFLASRVLGFSFPTAFLLGAIIASTDAAAVFSVLRSRKVSLMGNLKPLLELESGSNDPMAVFLTVGLIQLTASPEKSISDILVLFLFQMGIGAITGFSLGKLMVLILNHLRFAYEGIYPVFLLAFASLVYGATSLVGGSGFLSVYIAGLVVGNSDFVHKKSLLRFFDGLAWLSQIAMFVALGLLVFPSRLIPVFPVGLVISGFLMFVARPLSVHVSLMFSRFHMREKALISWVGIRGAVPIILATFPLLANLPDAEVMFNLVFFIVLTSALLQGWSVPIMAHWLRVDAPPEHRKVYPIEFTPPKGVDTELVDLIVPYDSDTVGKSIVELGMPDDSLVVLLSRNDDFIVPSGGTILEAGDTLLVLVNKRTLPEIREILSKPKET